MAKQFYTKCGLKFSKSSNASVTSYEYPVDKIECQNCQYKEEVERYRGNENVKIKMCQAGEKKPKYETSYDKNNKNDSTGLHIKTLDLNLINYLESNFSSIPGILGGYFNSLDSSDCRKIYAISFEKNKKGIAAKQQIMKMIDEYKPEQLEPVKEKGITVVAKGNVEIVDDREMKLNNYISDLSEKSQNIVNDYINIGITLIKINKEKLYEVKGYSNLIEFAYNELNFSKTLLYNTMAIAEKFSVFNEYSEEGFIIKPEYKNFSLSQLSEMLSIPDDNLSDIKPEMTVKEIREVKKDSKTDYCEVITKYIQDANFMPVETFIKNDQGGSEALFNLEADGYIHHMKVIANSKFSNIDISILNHDEITNNFINDIELRVYKNDFINITKEITESIIGFRFDMVLVKHGYKVDSSIYFSTYDNRWDGEYSKSGYCLSLNASIEFDLFECELYPEEGSTGDDEWPMMIECISIKQVLDTVDEKINSMDENSGQGDDGHDDGSPSNNKYLAPGCSDAPTDNDDQYNIKECDNTGCFANRCNGYCGLEYFAVHAQHLIKEHGTDSCDRASEFHKKLCGSANLEIVEEPEKNCSGDCSSCNNNCKGNKSNKEENIRKIDLAHDLITQAQEILFSIPAEQIDSVHASRQRIVTGLHNVNHDLMVIRPETRCTYSEKERNNLYLASENLLRPLSIRKQLFEQYIKDNKNPQQAGEYQERINIIDRLLNDIEEILDNYDDGGLSNAESDELKIIKEKLGL